MLNENALLLTKCPFIDEITFCLEKYRFSFTIEENQPFLVEDVPFLPLHNDFFFLNDKKCLVVAETAETCLVESALFTLPNAPFLN